jgi:tRNA(adenine34) deaminase
VPQWPDTHSNTAGAGELLVFYPWPVTTNHREMGLAIEQAERAESHGDVPIGAVIVRYGEVIAAAGNRREADRDPTAHAELLAIREASRVLGGWRLPGTVLYVTLEPCAMCAGAIVLARIPEVVFGAHDPKAGAAGSVMNVLDDPALNHRPKVTAGIREAECAALLTGFFRTRR